MIVQNITANIRLDLVRLADGTIQIDSSNILMDFGGRAEDGTVQLIYLTPEQVQTFKTPLTEQWAEILDQELLPVLED